MGVIVQGLADVKTTLLKAAENAQNNTLSALERAGQRLVEIARATKQYQDQTGNLSASIGYGVYSNGNEISVGGFGGGEGGEKGRVFLAEVASQYSSSKFALIVVAGMDYALYVERRGYVVLDGAMLRANDAFSAEFNSIKL